MCIIDRGSRLSLTSSEDIAVRETALGTGPSEGKYREDGEGVREGLNEKVCCGNASGASYNEKQ